MKKQIIVFAFVTLMILGSLIAIFSISKPVTATDTYYQCSDPLHAGIDIYNHCKNTTTNTNAECRQICADMCIALYAKYSGYCTGYLGEDMMNFCFDGCLNAVVP